MAKLQVGEQEKVVGSRNILGATWYFTRRNPIYSPSNNTSGTTYTVNEKKKRCVRKGGYIQSGKIIGRVQNPSQYSSSYFLFSM